MNSRIKPIVLLTAILWLASGQPTYPSTDDGPTAVLRSLDEKVQERSLLIDGSLPYVSGVDAWNLIVNDTVILTLNAETNHNSTTLRVAVALRFGDNTISIDSLRKIREGAPVTLKHWSTHVYAESNPNPREFAILIKGEVGSSVDADFQAVYGQLIRIGIPESDIVFTKTRADLASAFGAIREKMSTVDRLFIYFRGTGVLANSDGEPILQLSSGDLTTGAWLPITELTREVPGPIPLSLVVDADLHPGSQSEPFNGFDGPQQANQSSSPDRTALAWLGSLHSSVKTEVLLSNPFTTQRSGALTSLLLSRMTENSPGACRTLAEVTPTETRAFVSDASIQPLYFTNTISDPGICISQTDAATQQLKLSVNQYLYADPFMMVARVEATMAPGIAYSWREVLVDGIVVRHRFMDGSQNSSNPITELVSLAEGTHLIEIRVGVGSGTIASGRTLFKISPPTIDVKSESQDLDAEIVRPTQTTSITSSGLFTVGFVVADSKTDSVHYELRNNGVVILRGVAWGRGIGHHLEILRRIPVSVGENNIVIEVRRDNYKASSHCTVIRLVEQPLHAVIIGADQVPALRQLKGVQSDVESVKKLLFDYTDLNANELVTLTGPNATSTAIREAIGNSTITHPIDPISQAGGDQTLFLYFSGYGTTLLDDSRKPTSRCILTADFDSRDPAKGCLSTADLDSLLDSWTRSIIVFDTSYDGLAGTRLQSVSKDPFISRTYGDFLSTDPQWRAISGTDRPDRVFLAGSKSNTAALESGNPPQGLFTSSLVEAIEELLPGDRINSFRKAELFDAFAFARNKTITKSNNSQTPLIKGALSVPFFFRLRNPVYLLTEARAIDVAILDDVESLRSVDPNEIDRAATLYDTVTAMQFETDDAQQGKARIFIYKNDLTSAENLVALGLSHVEVEGANSARKAGWLLLRCLLKMRRGNIPDALNDCEAANGIDAGSASAMSLLAALYLASGQYDKSAILTEELLSQASRLGQQLTDDEWGHVVLLGYVAIRLSKGPTDSDTWLKRYFSSYRDHHSFLGELGLGLASAPKSIAGVNPRTPAFTIQSPWVQLVTDFFLRPQTDLSALVSFNETNATFDAKNPSSIDFMAHFYQGMKFIMTNSPALAKGELELAMKSGQTQFVEYWIAQAQRDRIN
jgi:hypothetical protein